MAAKKSGSGGKKKGGKKPRRNPAALRVVEGGRADWNEDMRQYCEGIDPAIMLADGFERAFIGTAHHAGNGDVAVYDMAACLKSLVDGGMSEEEAQEYFDHNVSGAFMGSKTPVFITFWPRALKGR